MVKPEERWMRQAVYRLKRQFPCYLSLYQNTSVGVDYSTGLKTDVRVSCIIEKAALLPSRSSRSSGPGSNQMDGLFDSRNRTFLVDRSDIPSGFKIDNNLELVHEHKRYKTVAIQVFGDEFYEIKAVWLEGMRAKEIVPIHVTELFNFDESTS